MNSVLDLFMGDPVYDEQKNVIRRDFGVKNIVAIMVVGFIGYSLMGEMKPISGKGKMKGGGGWGWIAVLWLIFVLLMYALVIGAADGAIHLFSIPEDKHALTYGVFVGLYTLLLVRKMWNWKQFLKAK